MTLVISKGITLRNQLPADTDADAYIAAVEAADGQALEPGVKFAIKNFVLCCKQDGIWDAIKASCILAGARTRLGALTPLVGAVPTSFNFVDGDYNRKTGLASSSGGNKYINSGQPVATAGNAHLAFYATQTSGINQVYIGVRSSVAGVVGASEIFTGSPTTASIIRSQAATGDNPATIVTGLTGLTRSSAANYAFRTGNTNFNITRQSETPAPNNVYVFATNSVSESPSFNSVARLAFYSIGESLDLTLLDARVTDLINAFAAAIP
jgi:hypothetical protein